MTKYKNIWFLYNIFALCLPKWETVRPSQRRDAEMWNASSRTLAIFGIEEGPEQRTTGERIGKVNLGQWVTNEKKHLRYFVLMTWSHGYLLKLQNQTDQCNILRHLDIWGIPLTVLNCLCKLLAIAKILHSNSKFTFGFYCIKIVVRIGRRKFALKDNKHNTEIPMLAAVISKWNF